MKSVKDNEFLAQEDEKDEEKVRMKKEQALKQKLKQEDAVRQKGGKMKTKRIWRNENWQQGKRKKGKEAKHQQAAKLEDEEEE